MPDHATVDPSEEIGRDDAQSPAYGRMLSPDAAAGGLTYVLEACSALLPPRRSRH